MRIKYCTHCTRRRISLSIVLWLYQNNGCCWCWGVEFFFTSWCPAGEFRIRHSVDVNTADMSQLVTLLFCSKFEIGPSFVSYGPQFFLRKYYVNTVSQRFVVAVRSCFVCSIFNSNCIVSFLVDKREISARAECRTGFVWLICILHHRHSTVHNLLFVATDNINLHLISQLYFPKGYAAEAPTHLLWAHERHTNLNWTHIFRVYVFPLVVQ